MPGSTTKPRFVLKVASPFRMLRLGLRDLPIRTRTIVLLLACVGIVATGWETPSMVQLPILLAAAGCVTSLHARVFRVLGGRLSARMAKRQRDEALRRRFQSLCAIGDFPQRQERVSDLVVFIAAKAGCSCNEQKQLAVASTLHRIGLVSLPPCGAQSRKAVSRRAADMAARLLAGNTHLDRLAIEMASCHGESWDGSGEAFGLAGETIPFSARLLHVALALDALLPRTGNLPLRADLLRIATRLEAEGGRTLDPTLAGLSLLHIDALDGLLQSHFGRHSLCSAALPGWPQREPSYAVGAALTTA